VKTIVEASVKVKFAYVYNSTMTYRLISIQTASMRRRFSLVSTRRALLELINPFVFQLFLFISTFVLSYYFLYHFCFLNCFCIIIIFNKQRLTHMGGFTCDVLAVKICKLFESDFQSLLVLLHVIR
jgi:hypothetical protein